MQKKNSEGWKNPLPLFFYFFFSPYSFPSTTPYSLIIPNYNVMPRYFVFMQYDTKITLAEY